MAEKATDIFAKVNKEDLDVGFSLRRHHRSPLEENSLYTTYEALEAEMKNEHSSIYKGQIVVTQGPEDDKKSTYFTPYLIKNDNDKSKTSYYADRILTLSYQNEYLDSIYVKNTQLGTQYTGVGQWADVKGQEISTYTYSEVFNDYNENKISIHEKSDPTLAYNMYSHAEGSHTYVTMSYGHAEGFNTYVKGTAGHSEGIGSKAHGAASHAEGSAFAQGDYSHAGGNSDTISQGAYSFANGIGAKALGEGSMSVGNNTISTGISSVAMGTYTNADGEYTVALGNNTRAIGSASMSEGCLSYAYGTSSHAEGYNSYAIGNYSHAEGYNSYANGDYSHAEGYNSIADKDYSHAEGNSKATGDYSHAEGQGEASGDYSHAEGKANAINIYAHAEGQGTANSESSHAEGQGEATGNYSHAEGQAKTLGGMASHAEGNSKAKGEYSHAEGYATYAEANYSHTEGNTTTATKEGAHAEGNYTSAEGIYSHAEGSYSYAQGEYSHAEGLNTYAIGNYSHVEGNKSIAAENYSHAEGLNTIAYIYSHAEGNETKALGTQSHSEGANTKASGMSSHAEGNSTEAYGIGTHAEGYANMAYGDYSHAEGYNSYAIKDYSHAGGYNTYARGEYSFSGGFATATYGTASMSVGAVTHARGDFSFASGYMNIAPNCYEYSTGLMNRSYTTSAEESEKITSVPNEFARLGGKYVPGRYPTGITDANKTEVAYYDSSYETIFTIGNGSSTDISVGPNPLDKIDGQDAGQYVKSRSRHNVMDIRKNGQMYYDGGMIVGGEIVAPMSYSYVASLGPTAYFTTIMSALLTQPEYYRPYMKYKFWSSGEIDFNWNGNYTTVEVGTSFNCNMTFHGYRVAYDCMQHLDPIYGTTLGNMLGYTRGITEITYKLCPNNGKGSVAQSNAMVDSKITIDRRDDDIYLGYFGAKLSLGKDLGGGKRDTFAYNPNGANISITYNNVLGNNITIGTEDTYSLIQVTSYTWAEASQMYFQQLAEKGTYIGAAGTKPTEKWDTNEKYTCNGNFKVVGAYKIYWGTTNKTCKEIQAEHDTDQPDKNGTYSKGWDGLVKSTNQMKFVENKGAINSVTNTGDQTLSSTVNTIWIAAPAPLFGCRYTNAISNNYIYYTNKLGTVGLCTGITDYDDLMSGPKKGGSTPLYTYLTHGTIGTCGMRYRVYAFTNKNKTVGDNSSTKYGMSIIRKVAGNDVTDFDFTSYEPLAQYLYDTSGNGNTQTAG